MEGVEEIDTKAEQNARRRAGMEHRRGKMFHEKFLTKYGEVVSIFSVEDKKDVYYDERCYCHAEKADDCMCDIDYPLDPRKLYKTMSKKEMQELKPFLMYSIHKVSNPDIRFSFFAKKEEDVLAEVNRLNKKEDLPMIRGSYSTHNPLPSWVYYEEKQYNKAAKAEFALFLKQISHYQMNE